MKKQLPSVTLAVIDTHNYGDAIASLKRSLTQIEPARSVFLTNIQTYNPKLPFEVIKIDKLENKAAYSNFVIKELYKHFDTDFVLVTQHDGWVLNGDAWRDEFMDYDYIGAAWLEQDGYNVGNGGFSLRSKRLQYILGMDEFLQAAHPEDAVICRLYRPYLETKYGIKFAPDEVADKFSFELREPVCATFGFHGKFHQPFKPTVVIKRSAAMGDVIATEPLLEYYHNKGYNVALDTNVDFFYLFIQHYEGRFPVKHISQLDKRIPVTTIDLDGSYEDNPNQLHLKSYYETAGIIDGKIKNPKLHFVIGEHNRLFQKYVVIHSDIRDQQSRNISGVDWEEVVKHLNSKGYLAVQVGGSYHENIEGAVQIKTVATNFLMYVIAGASLFVGVDSGPASIAVATNIPSVIFFGSVNPENIHPDLSNVLAIHNHGKNVCEKPFCWANTPGSTTGTKCYIDDEEPPCSLFTTEQAIEGINKMLK